ncbi:hypothetical protein S-CBS1_gp06 [Synechococcus phage S-CBS1]|jgi:hypothetical protein|uniref:hypothetical protein n=1 Tax=Synechococcus phage S-CBS1 TaxID=909297 RepID=UPI000231E282|nr:hypothetical protein S-CBS1_gp06 [Synechococcus phage S-CBS1]ADP06611.1 hypothetical protein S-CBS1_gp06 [Synechococcus phage S-CBS1]
MSLPRIGGFSAPGTADYADLDYDGSDRLITITYKQGGASGGVVGTLNMTYVGESTNVDTIYWS